MSGGQEGAELVGFGPRDDVVVAPVNEDERRAEMRELRPRIGERERPAGRGEATFEQRLGAGREPGADEKEPAL